MLSQKINLPNKLAPLFMEPARYRVAYGGRGSGKSWGFAIMAVLRAVQGRTRILCARELQKSIKESSHKLISDTIHRLGLQEQFAIGETSIRHQNGSEFIFMGLRYNREEIKSTEGLDVVWVDEASSVSKASLDVLRPTVRKEGSEIWFTFNPMEEDDEVYQMFVVGPKPSNSVVVEINYQDNPFFGGTLEQERLDCLRNDKDNYDHIWGGRTRRFAGGAIYGKEMLKCKADGRITRVPYTSSVPVFTVWDLGYSKGNATSIGFGQLVGREPRIIDYYENELESIEHYLKVLREKQAALGYNYSLHVFPHDAGHNSLRTGKTFIKQLEDMGLGKEGRDMLVLPIAEIEPGIELVRQLLGNVWFDEERCADLIKALHKYHYEYDEERKVFKNRPVHDWASNPADMMRYFATHLATQKVVVPRDNTRYANPMALGNLGWMG